MIASGRVLLRMRHILGRFVEKIKAKDRAVYEMMWKNMVESNRHRWQHNTAHALCMLDN